MTREDEMVIKQQNDAWIVYVIDKRTSKMFMYIH